jgi:hypothetical protein
LQVLPDTERDPYCRELAEDAQDYPNDPGVNYLAALCVSDPDRRAELLPSLSERFPDYPFLTRASGLQAFVEGDTGRALTLLRKAFHEDPRTMLEDIDFLARLSRLEGGSQTEILAEIGPWSPATRKLAAPEGPEPPSPLSSSLELSLKLLHLGRPEDALNIAPESIRNDMTLLAAASDGAPRGLVESWDEYYLPSYLDVRTVWCQWGLSVREDKTEKIVRAEAFILERAEDPELATRSFKLIRDKDWPALKDLIRNYDPWFQGQLALAASLVWGSETPEETRRIAKSYLFIGERPFME